MALKGLECYDRRVLVTSPGDQLIFKSTKGNRLIIPGMLFGVRQSYNGDKIRCILDDDTHRVFTISWEDFWKLQDNSIPYEDAVEQGIIDAKCNSN